MHPFTDTALHVISPVAALLLGLCLLGPGGAAAQVQINQVPQATGQVQGASQAEVIVATGHKVSSDQILNLIQNVAPPTATNGNSASVLQDGNRNDVAIQQAGTGSRAVAEQLGSDNAIAVTQDGAGSDAVPFDDDEPAAGAAFDAIQRTSLVGSGSSNLAVAVHEGSNNQTGILQRGDNNVAGIRLVGDDNTMNLVQAGRNNKYLMDAKADGMEKTVVQNGNDNSMQTNLPVNAEINGNGIELIIQRNALGPVSFE